MQQQAARTTEQLDFSHQPGFFQSLALGEAAEEHVKSKYRALGCSIVEPDSSGSLTEKRAWDFVVVAPDRVFTVEVKRDMLAHSTGNVCIEHRAVSHSQATYFAYAIDGCPQVFQLDHMRPVFDREFCGVRPATLDDSTLTRLIRRYSHTWAQRGYGSAYWSTLVPINDFIRYATPL